MTFLHRLRQLLRLGRQIWRMRDPHTLLVSYSDDEPAIIFSDEATYGEINQIMRLFFDEETAWRRK